jgi:hypothetical protein
VAAESGRVFFTAHAEKRMKQRRITRTQALTCLREGSIVEGPYRDIRGDWRCTVEKFVAGDSVQVVVVIEISELLVITVI